MARIRSIHPGMRTDEDYMALSFAGRCCLAGVWIEADDHGVFKWKPKTLKAQIFPGDNVDIEALLCELETHNWVKRFQHEGEEYAICRNFIKWQRPKNPSYQHPFPEELWKYAGVKETETTPPPPALPQASPSTTEKLPQREEGGGKRDKEEVVVATPSAQDVSALLSKTTGHLNGRDRPSLPPNERKAIWQSKIIVEAQRTMGEREYACWLDAFGNDLPWAKRKAEEIDKTLKARAPPRTRNTRPREDQTILDAG